MKDLDRLKKMATDATPGPWGPWSANVPFYVNVKKPSPSMSKHDADRPTYWKKENENFIYFKEKRNLWILFLYQEKFRIVEFHEIHHRKSRKTRYRCQNR